IIERLAGHGKTCASTKELRQGKRCWSPRLRFAGGIQYLVCAAAYAYLATLACRVCPFRRSISVVPNEAGLDAMAIPAERMASSLSEALPLPPEMMAPAYPMRRPGGAVTPAMNPAMGFERPRLASLLMNSAASSSAEPPISPIMMMESVLGSARNS